MKKDSMPSDRLRVVSPLPHRIYVVRVRFIETSNNERWPTRLAKADGEYDAQLYRYKIEEDPYRISKLGIEWEGIGEPYEGYETELYILVGRMKP